MDGKWGNEERECVFGPVEGGRTIDDLVSLNFFPGWTEEMLYMLGIAKTL